MFRQWSSAAAAEMESPILDDCRRAPRHDLNAVGEEHGLANAVLRPESHALRDKGVKIAALGNPGKREFNRPFVLGEEETRTGEASDRTADRSSPRPDETTAGAACSCS